MYIVKGSFSEQIVDMIALEEERKASKKAFHVSALGKESKKNLWFKLVFRSKNSFYQPYCNIPMKSFLSFASAFSFSLSLSLFAHTQNSLLPEKTVSRRPRLWDYEQRMFVCIYVYGIDSKKE